MNTEIQYIPKRLEESVTTKESIIIKERTPLLTK